MAQSKRKWFEHLSYELPEGIRQENMLLHSNLNTCSDSIKGDVYSDSELLKLGKHIDELPYETVFKTSNGNTHTIVRDRRKLSSKIVPVPRYGLSCRIPSCYFDASSTERIQDHYSFSGAQDKFTAIVERIGDDIILHIPDRQREIGNVIVKPWAREYDFQPENEYFSMRIMEECGFDTARTALFSAETDIGIKHMHLCVERFDIDFNVVPHLVKFKVRQVAELMGLPTNSVGKYALTTKELFSFIKKTLAPNVQSEFAMRYLFGYILGNGDMHAKNFSIIYNTATETWMLSPVYDMLNTRVYGFENHLCLPLGEREDRHSPDPFVLIDFLSDFLDPRGFEILYERLQKFLDTIQLVGAEIQKITEEELPEENLKSSSARAEFLHRLSESAQSEAIWFLKTIEQYYLPNQEEPNSFEQTI